MHMVQLFHLSLTKWILKLSFPQIFQIGVTIDIFADMFPANLRGARIVSTVWHPINILMVYRRSGIDNCSVTAKDGIIRICRSLARGIRILRCKIVLAVIKPFGSSHSVRRWSELRHVVVHVISVLGVIDALFAAVKHLLTDKSSCRIISIQETLVVDKVLMRIHVS